MSVRVSAVLRVLFSVCFALNIVTSPATAQGFAGLGTTAKGFAKPVIGMPFVFPRDHGAHRDFRIEWWYLTANLKGADGKDYGAQWTLFRSALRPENEVIEGWTSTQLWMGHAAVTTPEQHYVSELRARGGIGTANVTADPFRAFIGDWQMVSKAGNEEDAFSRLDINASGEDFSYALALQTDKPLVRHGKNGYSVKSQSGQASYYYSQPFYTVTGTLNLPAGNVSVTGSAWLDREWSSQPLADNQNGWDWVSLDLGQGQKLMGFRLRQTDGSNFTSATLIAADGTPTSLGDGELTMEPLGNTEVAGRDVPVKWQVKLPSHDIDIRLEALNPKAWMATSFPYWEGPVRVSGSHEGLGYLEMTGY